MTHVANGIKGVVEVCGAELLLGVMASPEKLWAEGKDRHAIAAPGATLPVTESLGFVNHWVIRALYIYPGFFPGFRSRSNVTCEL